MYCIFGEDSSDTLSIKAIIRRLSGNEKLAPKIKNFSGCGDMLNKGHRVLKLFHGEGCTHFIICYDADGPDPEPKYKEIQDKIIKKSGIDAEYLILVPVHELEAWILADNSAILKSGAIKSWIPVEVRKPESQPDAKEHLIRITRGENGKPRYDYVNHNPIVAEHLDLDVVREKCPSFRPLALFFSKTKLATQS